MYTHQKYWTFWYSIYCWRARILRRVVCRVFVYHKNYMARRIGPSFWARWIYYYLFVMLMNLIGFVIENLSYNWSIITHRNSNTNAVVVFHCIKLENVHPRCTFFFSNKKKRLGMYIFIFIDKFDTMKNSYSICIWISICNYRPVIW